MNGETLIPNFKKIKRPSFDIDVHGFDARSYEIKHGKNKVLRPVFRYNFDDEE